MKSKLCVSDVMSHIPITVSAETTLRDAATKMRDDCVGSLLVVDQGSSAGIVTEADLVRKAMSQGFDVDKMLVSDVMTLIHDIKITTPQTDIFDALMKMNDYEIRHLPVIENKKLVGVISLKDILKVEPQILEILDEEAHLGVIRKQVYTKRVN